MNALDWLIVRKDWYFVRWPMAGYATIGALALAMIAFGRGVTFYAGAVILISVVVTIGIHFVFGAVVTERSKNTLPFALSLPIDFRQYTRTKLVGCLTGFAVPWLVLATTTVLIIYGTDHLNPGLVPFALIVLGELFVAFVVTLAVAMVFESEAATVVVMTVLNIGISIFMFTIGSIPSIAANIDGSAAVWSPAAVGIVAGEAGLIVLLIAATWWLQSRKTDFV